jgi:hypothetical protein
MKINNFQKNLLKKFANIKNDVPLYRIEEVEFFLLNQSIGY